MLFIINLMIKELFITVLLTALIQACNGGDTPTVTLAPLQEGPRIVAQAPTPHPNPQLNPEISPTPTPALEAWVVAPTSNPTGSLVTATTHGYLMVGNEYNPKLGQNQLSLFRLNYDFTVDQEFNETVKKIRSIYENTNWTPVQITETLKEIEVYTLIQESKLSHLHILSLSDQGEKISEKEIALGIDVTSSQFGSGQMLFTGKDSQGILKMVLIKGSEMALSVHDVPAILCPPEAKTQYPQVYAIKSLIQANRKFLLVMTATCFKTGGIAWAATEWNEDDHRLNTRRNTIWISDEKNPISDPILGADSTENIWIAGSVQRGPDTQNILLTRINSYFTTSKRVETQITVEDKTGNFLAYDLKEMDDGFMYLAGRFVPHENGYRAFAYLAKARETLDGPVLEKPTLFNYRKGGESKHEGQAELQHLIIADRGRIYGSGFVMDQHNPRGDGESEVIFNIQAP